MATTAEAVAAEALATIKKTNTTKHAHKNPMTDRKRRAKMERNQYILHNKMKMEKEKAQIKESQQLHKRAALFQHICVCLCVDVYIVNV